MAAEYTVKVIEVENCEGCPFVLPGRDNESPACDAFVYLQKGSESRSFLHLVGTESSWAWGYPPVPPDWCPLRDSSVEIVYDA